MDVKTEDIDVTARPLNLEDFERAAAHLTMAERRAIRAADRVRLAELERSEAQDALKGAQVFLEEMVRLAVNAVAQRGFFPEESPILPGNLRLVKGVVTGPTGELKEVTFKVSEAVFQAISAPPKTLSMSAALSVNEERAALGMGPIPEVPVNPNLIRDEARPGDPVPEMFHVERCNRGEDLGACFYGDPDCPVLAALPQEAEDPLFPDQSDAPIIWTVLADGTVTLTVREREIAMAGRTKPAKLPAGEIEGLDWAPEFFVYRDLLADCWKATTDEAETRGRARLAIGSVQLPSHSDPTV
jgi:hypothetical protein